MGGQGCPGPFITAGAALWRSDSAQNLLSCHRIRSVDGLDRDRAFRLLEERAVEPAASARRKAAELTALKSPLAAFASSRARALEPARAGNDPAAKLENLVMPGLGKQDDSAEVRALRPTNATLVSWLDVARRTELRSSACRPHPNVARC